MLAVVLYTQVLPTAMGKGTEPVVTSVFELELGLEVAPGLVVLEVAADDVLPAAAPELPADAPHPARVTTAAPTRTARADPNLVM
jgi:hypothetical protein